MRKQCKRKRRGVGLSPMFGFDEEMTNLLLIYPYSYLDAMLNGEGSESGARSLQAVCRICERMSGEYTDDIQAIARQAVAAAEAVLERGLSSGRWGCSGDDYRAIRDGLNLLVEIKESGVRRKEFCTAINNVMGWA